MKLPGIHRYRNIDPRHPDNSPQAERGPTFQVGQYAYTLGRRPQLPGSEARPRTSNLPPRLSASATGAATGAQRTTAARDAGAVTAIQQRLPASTTALTHPRHGQAEFRRADKAAGSREVGFALTLTPHEGEPLTETHSMYLRQGSELYSNKLILEFGDIFLPEGAQRKGLGSLYLREAAKTAQQAGAAFVVVDGIVSEGMVRLCRSSGMSPRAGTDALFASPTTILEALNTRARMGEWSEIT